MMKKTVTMMILVMMTMMLFGQGKSLQQLGNEAEVAGDEAYTAKNYTQAQAKYKESIAKYKESEAAEQINLGDKISGIQEKLFKAYYFDKKYNEAIGIYKDMLKKDPSDQKKILIVAQIYEKGLKQLDKAIAHLKEFDAKKADFKLRKEIASLYTEMDNKQEAINWYNKAKEIRQDANIIQKTAVLYRELGQIPNAIKEYEDYLKTNPSESSKYKTYMNMGALYEQIKKPQEAINAYEKSLGVKFDSKIATKLMVMYYDTKNYAKATEKINLLLNKDSKDADAIYYHAQILYNDGDKNGALAEFKKIESNAKYGESAKGFIKSIESEL